MESHARRRLLYAVIPFIPEAPEPHNEIGSTYDEVGNVHFIADLIREFLLLIGVKYCLTFAYSMEENAIVESYNKEINRWSAMHPSRSTKSKIRILGIVERERRIALHYSVHFFAIFLRFVTIMIEMPISVVYFVQLR